MGKTCYTPSGGWISQAAASTQLFFAALQRRHLLRLNLHSTQAFYLYPFQKRPRGPSLASCIPRGDLATVPRTALWRPHLNQTNASFDAQGAPASPPPGTALSRHTPHSGLSFSPSLCEDFAAPHWIGTRRW